MIKYYEKTKADYSIDIDHLVTVNKNGLWIKENIENGYRIISADETKSNILKNINIIDLDPEFAFIRKIYAKKANISENEWKNE